MGATVKKTVLVANGGPARSASAGLAAVTLVVAAVIGNFVFQNVVAAGGGTDFDSDGFFFEVDDCDDARPTVNPEATEVPLNGIDDDCDPLTPINGREDFTCAVGPASESLVVSGNEYRTLNFNKPADIGEPAIAGDSFRYDQVGAIGGPTFDTGTVSGVTGLASPWTAIISVSDTTGLLSGMAVTAVRGPDGGGRIGSGGVYTITSIINGTDFTISAVGGSAPLAGPIAEIRTGKRVDARVTVVSVDAIVMEKVDDYSSTGTSNRRLDVEHGNRRELGNGTVGNIIDTGVGSGPWTAEITGLETTVPFAIGDQFTANSGGDGSIGDAGVYVITELGPDWIRYTATGGTSPVAGAIGTVSTWGVTEYRVDFLEAGTDILVDVEEVAVSLEDIDDTQFVEFKEPNTFRIDQTSRIEILTKDDLDIVPTGWMRAWSVYKSVSTDVRNWVEVDYDKTNSISLRLGQLDTSSAAFNLKFGLAGFVDPIECQLTLGKTPSTTTYTGSTGIVTAGSGVTLSATVGPETCTTPPDVTYTLIKPDSAEMLVTTNPLDTTGFVPGIYEIVAEYPGSETCESSEDRSLFVIASPGDSTTGGGIYQIDSGISGSPRVHFGFTVQRSSKTDKRTGSTEVIQRGNLLWMNNNQWRLKASLYSRTVTTGGGTTGDNPVFGTIPCPVGVGSTGSNPKCGVIVGGGWLERWVDGDGETEGGWERATDLGDGGWVEFSATIYDGGSVRVCKGRNCSITDVTDWFGMTMAGITTSDDVPVTAPIEVRKQQNGAIVIRI